MSKRQRSRSRSPGRRRRDRSRSPKRLSRSPPPRIHGKKQKICVDYARGNCFRGNECWFLHDEFEDRYQRRSYSHSKRDSSFYPRGRDVNGKSRSRELDDDYRHNGYSRREREESPSHRRYSRRDSPSPRPSTERVEEQHRVVETHQERRAVETNQQHGVVEAYDRMVVETCQEEHAQNETQEHQDSALPDHAGCEVADHAGCEVAAVAVAARDNTRDEARNEALSKPLPEVERDLEMFGAPEFSLELQKTQSHSPSDDRKKMMDREMRSLKVLRNAITDFVKESLKPAWKEGHLSKVAFKTIAQKAVDKVMGTLQGHEIPKGQAKIEQFMDSSHAKITKLVKGYLDKYVS
ncbi:uncharacterized protein LOC112342320 [Selaginella moellendorffii]|uniref:uncharacterized protein LOC112342320 n=1 Tax=Selaginella moellendorffii TaxID=88036 RepID=UPI000D1D089A|nr:uncharacterized protein LOC112342320 [Selaginella moellendorffii]|eukprot:XP_024519738.1 uncharacterized protein LOC112342320 [Selaginella moellendorffii]